MGFWKILLIILTLTVSVYAAHAIGLGEGNRFGRLGALSKAGTIASPVTGDILLVDGISLLLQTDGTSFVCRAGGC